MVYPSGQDQKRSQVAHQQEFNPQNGPTRKKEIGKRPIPAEMDGSDGEEGENPRCRVRPHTGLPRFEV